MTPPITKSDLETVWTSGEIARWSKGVGNVANDGNIIAAILKGWGEVRSALLNRYPAASVDALTTSTLPDLARGYAVALAVDWLSAGSHPREEIESQAKQARIWLALIVSQRDHTFAGILVDLSAGSSGGGSARIGAPRRDPFDADDPYSPLRQRLRRL